MLSVCIPSSDIGAVTEALYGEKTPPIVLMGHSMGGAIAVRAAVRGVVPALVGLAVIDVVEGKLLILGTGNETIAFCE